MKSYCIENLNQIKKLLLELNEEEYTKKLIHLSGASLGQHLRHILEFYQCLIQGFETKIINYDNRKRDILIENSTLYAVQIIQEISTFLNESIVKGDCILQTNFSYFEDAVQNIPSSLERELAYCLEHSIHHQAIIKIGLIEMNKLHCIDEHFGIAPTTIRFKKTCVQ